MSESLSFQASLFNKMDNDQTIEREIAERSKVVNIEKMIPVLKSWRLL